MGETLASIMNSRRAMSTELRNVNDYLRVALDNMARGVSMFDDKQRLIVCNKVYGEIYGIPDQLTKPGTPLSAIIRWYIRCESGSEAAIDVSGHLEWIRKEVAILAQGKLRTRTQVLFNGRTVRITTRPLPNGGWVDVQEDITEQCKQDSILDDLARQDPQTGLPNRLKFRATLEAALNALGDKTGFAVHVIDVDNLQPIKERFGFTVRDALMREFGKLLIKSVSSPDLAARIDGDVFALICPNTESEQTARDAAARLNALLSQHYDIYGHSIELRLRVITVFAPVDGTDAEQIISSALKGARAGTH